MAPRIHCPAALAVALALTPALQARRWAATETPAMPRRTEAFPRDYVAPEGAAGPVLSECEAPRILIGNLEMPRERGGVFNRDLRPPPSFDGLPVEAPGFFRMQRAEDAIGASRGPNGILGLRDPMVLRGHLVTRRYKEKRPYWVAPGLMTERVFSAGAMKRFPLVRTEMSPGEFLKHLRGHESHMTVILENPTDFFIPEITLRLYAEPEHTSFPTERRMEIEGDWSYQRVLTTDLGARDRKKFSLRLPGKPSRAAYHEVEATVVAGRRWPYPGVGISHPVRQTMAEASDQLERLLPRRTLLVTAGDIEGCGEAPYPVVIRYERKFRSFGTELDGLDLEVMAAWDQQDDQRFQAALAQGGAELGESLPPMLRAALSAKSRRVPVQRRPGGYDEFDAMAQYLYGSIADAGEGHTDFHDEDDRFGAPADHLYRHEGTHLPASQREEMRDRLKAIFAPRTVRGLSPEAAADGPLEYSPEDAHLEAGMHDAIYDPAHDWVTDERRIRKNRVIRRQRNERQFWSDEPAAKKSSARSLKQGRGRSATAVEVEAVAKAPAEAPKPVAPKPKVPKPVAPPKPVARPKPTPKPAPRPKDTPKPMAPVEKDPPKDPAFQSGDFEDDFGGFE